MKRHNPDNERIKRKYLQFLREAKRQSEATLDEVAKAIARFEEDTNWRDFRQFHTSQAKAFKEHLRSQKNARTGKPLSKATLHSTCNQLRRFFEWLSMQPGYKSRLNFWEAEYFNVLESESRIAGARRTRPVPTIEQIKVTISHMPATTDIELRDRAVMAFILLTGARDRAVASMSLKHVQIERGIVLQDAREVRTKFSKTFQTDFFPVGDDILQIVINWVEHLRSNLFWGENDPLFPATEIAVGESGGFQPVGLKRAHWSNADPIRKIFRRAFEAAGLEYFNPHSFRNTLARLGMKLCKSGEELKAWSQNLGHEQVLTTLYNYGEIPDYQQSEIIRSLVCADSSAVSPDSEVEKVVRAIVKEMKGKYI